jgi:glutamyl-tRNA reductase
MAGGASAPAQYVVVGANHRSSSVTLRDTIFVEDGAAPALLQALVAAGFEEAMLLSTCDRVELQGTTRDPDAARAAATRVLAVHGGIDADALAGSVYLEAGPAALRHMFAVAASLDSAILGEPQVLGQVKAAHRLARDAGTVGSVLESAIQAAYGAAKRVRRETAIAQGPVSIIASAVEHAREVHGDLAPLAALLIGTGDMGQLMAEELMRAGLGRVLVAAPKLARAAEIARQLGGHFADFETLAAQLTDADIVIACAGSGRYLVSTEMMEQALRRRRRRPVYLIDLGVPSDVEPGVNRIDDAYLYDLADLERSALASQASRAQAADSAWRILDEELDAFQRGRAERAAVPALTALRRHFEAERERILAESTHADAAEATRLLVSRLLHEPSEALRALAAETGDAAARMAAEELLRRLFHLAPNPKSTKE